MSKEDIVESDKNSQSESNSKNKIKRERNAPPSKVVIRGLPPTMTQDTFVEQVSPLPDHDYLYFVRADLSLGQFAFSRAYINFLNSEDIFIFTEKFDGYIFVDQKGNEYPAVVEFSPFQKIPKRVSRKKDAKYGTIEADPDYLKFLEQRTTAAETEAGPPSTQEVLEEIEAKERELRAHHGVLKMSTPLLDFLRHRKEEKIRIREEKKEERKRREADRRKMREEERRRPKDVSSYSRDSGKDKSKVDRTPKQLLTHKEKDSQATDAELTKKLKEALKINASPDKHDKQKKEPSSRDGADKDKTSSREKDKSASREKEHHKEKEGSKDRPEKLKDREQRKEKDLQWQEREDRRAKQRAEERARRNAARKAAWSEKKEKEQKSQNASSHKEGKGQQATGEDKKKPQTADIPKDKLEEAVKPSSSHEEATCEKSEVKLEKSSSEEPMATKEEQTAKEEESDSKKGDETKKSGASTKPKPERIRNKVGMELTEKGKNIKNKDRPSMQLYRPGMLKKRPSNVTSESAASASSKEGGAKLGAGQESASTSSSSSPTPPASNSSSKEKAESKRRSSAPPTKSKPQSGDVMSRDSERAKSDDDKVKEDIPVKSRTFKRSFS